MLISAQIPTIEDLKENINLGPESPTMNTNKLVENLETEEISPAKGLTPNINLNIPEVIFKKTV